jgi:hypothetical protein
MNTITTDMPSLIGTEDGCIIFPGYAVRARYEEWSQMTSRNLSSL